MTRELAAVVALVGVVPSADVRADEYEASVDIAAEGGLAILADDGSEDTARVAAAGLSFEVTYGLSNLLAIGAQVAGGTYGRATVDDAIVTVGGSAQGPGTLARTTRYGRVQIGATLRFGARWIPTVGFDLGLGARLRGHASFSDPTVMDVQPDDDGQGLALDALATVRAGLDYRIDAHWIVGVDVAATHAVAVQAPAADVVTARIGVAYYWYPLW